MNQDQRQIAKLYQWRRWRYLSVERRERVRAAASHAASWTAAWRHSGREAARCGEGRQVRRAYDRCSEEAWRHALQPYVALLCDLVRMWHASRALW